MDDHSFFMGSEIPALNSWSEVVSPSESATFAASQQPFPHKKTLNSDQITKPRHRVKLKSEIKP